MTTSTKKHDVLPVPVSTSVHAPLAPSPLPSLACDTVLRTPQKSALKDIAYGSIAGMVSKVFEHPFDLVKVRLQSQSGQHHTLPFSGPLDCFRKTIRKEGIKGLYRGLSMPVMGAMSENATLFLVYNQSQRLIRHVSGQSSSSDALSIPQLAVAAGCAGAVTSFVLTPVELIKCRMQVQQLALEHKTLGQHDASIRTIKLPGPFALVRETLQQQGTRGLWLGQTGTLLRETGGGAAWFCAFEVAIRYFLSRQPASSSSPPTKSELPDWQIMTAGACGGVSYNAFLFPADSIKSTMQTAAELGEPRRGFVETGRRIWAQRGIRGLYAGCGMTCLRSAPSSALIFWIVSRLEGQFD